MYPYLLKSLCDLILILMYGHSERLKTYPIILSDGPYSISCSPLVFI
jgi:hypothetical protein